MIETYGRFVSSKPFSGRIAAWGYDVIDVKSEVIVKTNGLGETFFKNYQFEIFKISDNDKVILIYFRLDHIYRYDVIKEKFVASRHSFIFTFQHLTVVYKFNWF